MTLACAKSWYTPTVPATGVVWMADIKGAFPGVGSALSGIRGKHPQVPSTGAIKFSSLRSKTAPSPNFTLVGATGTGVSFDSATGKIDGTAGGSLTLNLSIMLSSDVSAYQMGTSYSLATGSSLPAGVTLSSGGTLSVQPSAAATLGNVAFSVLVTNGWGNTATLPLTLNLRAPSAKVPLIPVMTADTTVVNGESYTVSASSTDRSMGYTPSLSFNTVLNQVHDAWTSALNLYDPTTGIINASGAYVTIDGTRYNGEWLRVDLPRASPIVAFDMSPRDSARITRQTPSVWYAFGSPDHGTTWKLIHVQPTVYNWTTMDPVAFLTTDSITAFNSFMIVFNTIGTPAGTNRNVASIGSMQLYSSYPS